MDWSLFWNAFGAIGTTLGAFATAAAVIVALWQTKFSTRLRLKIRFETYIFYDEEDGGADLSFNLYICNMGMRDVTVTGLALKKRKKRNNQATYVHVSDVFPKKLVPEESVDIHVSQGMLYSILMTLINDHGMAEKAKIPFVLEDSACRKYYFHSESTIEEYLNRIKEIHNINFEVLRSKARAARTAATSDGAEN